MTNNIPPLTHSATQQALASGAFNFQSAELNVKLDTLADQVAALTKAIHAPASPQKTTTSPSYSLAASKHAPRKGPTTNGEPENRAKRPTPRPAAHKLTTTITLTQKDPTAPVYTDQTTPRLLMALNNHLATKKIKVNETSKSPIEIKSIQRHASNDLVLYLESQATTDSLRKQANE